MVRTRSSESDIDPYTTECTSQFLSTYRDPYESEDGGYKSSDARTVSQQSYTGVEDSDAGYYSEDADVDTACPISAASCSLYDSRGVSASDFPSTLGRTFPRRGMRGPVGRSCISKRTTDRSTRPRTTRGRSVVFNDLNEYITIDRLDSGEKAENHRDRKASEALAKWRLRQGLD